MTTTQIADYADRGRLASSDMDLQVELRRNVIPLFYEDVSEVGWRRKHDVYSVLAGERDFALPLYFNEMKKIVAGVSAADFDRAAGLPYIGDNPELVAAAEAATVPGAPSGYYIDWNFAAFPIVRLAAPLDHDTTFRYGYITKAFFLNDSDEVQMDAFIPTQFQWALVESLKCVVFADRFGVGDNRWITADKKYWRFVEKARKNRERTGVEYPRFVN